MIKIFSVSAIAEWENFVEHSDECWIYHLPYFFDYKKICKTSFLIYENNKIVGGCIQQVKKSGWSKVLDSPYGECGLVLKNGIDIKIYKKEILTVLKNICKKNKCSEINLRLASNSITNIEKTYDNSYLKILGFNAEVRTGNEIWSTPTYANFVHLKIPNEMILKNYSESAKSDMRKQFNIKYEIKILKNEISEHDWNKFKNLHFQTLKRTKGPVNASVLNGLKNALKTRKAFIVLFEKNKTPLAAIGVLYFKKFAYTLATGICQEFYCTGLST